MASIKQYKTAKGTAWRVQYRSPDGRARTKQGFRTKGEATSWAASNTVAADTGTWIDPRAGKRTIGEIGDQLLEHRTHLKPSSLAKQQAVWKSIRPKWGDRQVGTIRPSEIREWIAGLELSASQIQQYHALLAQILDAAVADHMIPANPARGVKLPRRPAPKKVYLTIPQLRMLADECPRHAPIVWVLGTVGLRWGELAGLQVGDIDFLRGRIHIRRNAVQVGREVIVGTPKTHLCRTVAVTPFVLDMLEPLTRGKTQTDWIWTAKDGGPMKNTGSTSWLSRAVKRIQETKDPNFPHVTAHSLRHVAAGIMVSSGANVKVVQRQLGHASAAMTLDTYADLFDGDLDEVAGAMNEALSTQA
ncbi:site-specific integrase [Corynebacterium antarcticum]|uniref:site-specific integrase n=1 Tax=Corynebacterium antarcticum TaxID=2800405 RepID=UPI002003A5CC|nr:site-specific integrase [Corynebacterium antarcticum]MCK7662001.1 site-specific integrase [Corynebacterium antarcticum]